ncbi:recombinase family protein [Streptomyces sp. NPDC059757]|uniref:recombinase family protein n=1 Tax=Streptomyces sp. NPDC059757 TaxID=3346935 RepID=UPI0036627731
MARVLGVLRLSRASDESTAIVRQRAAIQRWADDKGHTIVGWVEDVDVSGGLEPWKRPDFKQWLPSTIGKDISNVEHRLAWEASRAGDFDIIAAWKLDRISRRVLHVHTLVEWCEKHGKRVETMEDGIDLSTPMGRILFNLIASFAEGELESIKARAKSSFTHLSKTGRWRGGFVPYGYRPEKQETGDGWRLVLDEGEDGTANHAREIVRRVLEGQTANSVCAWLNANKTPSPLDAQRIRSGKEPKGALWRMGNLVKMLRSHTLLGLSEVTEEITLSDGSKEKRTVIVEDENGLPLQRAEPLISRDEWERVGKQLDANANPRAGNRTGGSPLLRVAFCTCGQPLYRNKGRTGQYYRCAIKAVAGAQCEQNRSISAPLLEERVEEVFLSHAGDIEIVRRVFRPGIDYTRQIEEVSRSLERLREDRNAGLYDSTDGRDYWVKAVKSREAKLTELRSLPTRPDRWEEIPTGETYAERWAKLGTAAERAKELRTAGLTVAVHNDDQAGFQINGRWVVTLDEGRVIVPTGRMTVMFPRDFTERIQRMTAVHSES